MKKYMHITGLIAGLMFAATAAHATVVSFANRAAFAATYPHAFVEGWDTYSSGTVIVDGATVNGITYNSSAGNALVTSTFVTSTVPNGLGDNSVGFFQATDTITFSFAAAVAFAIDINTFALNPGAYTATTNLGDVIGSVFNPFPGFGTGQFIGFFSDTAFTSVTIGAAATPQPYTLDTLRIPEPGVIALLGLGLLALGFRRGRKSLFA